MTIKRRFEKQRLRPFVEADAFEGCFSGLEAIPSAGEKLATSAAVTSRFDPSDPPLEWIDLDFSGVDWSQLLTRCSDAELSLDDLEFVVLCQSRTLRKSSIVKRMSLKDQKALAAMTLVRITDGAVLADRWQFEIDVAIVLRVEKEKRPGHAWRPGSILEMVAFEWERVGESGGIDPKPLNDAERTRLSLPRQSVSYVVRSGIDPCGVGNPIEDIYVDSRLLALSKENPDDPFVALMLSLLLQSAVSQVLMEGHLRHEQGQCSCEFGAEPHQFSLLAQTLKRSSKGQAGFAPELLVAENSLGWPPLAEHLGRAKSLIHEWIKGQDASGAVQEEED